MDASLVKGRDSVLFNDLVFVWIVFFNRVPQPRVKLLERMDDYFNNHHIPEIYGHSYGNAYTFQLHIQKLRKFGLFTPKGKYILTEKGKDFIEEVLALHYGWNEWPVLIPYDWQQETFCLEEALYPKELFK